jgi:hypothetical protein
MWFFQIINFFFFVKQINYQNYVQFYNLEDTHYFAYSYKAVLMVVGAV